MERRIASSQSLSSGGHSPDPLAPRNDGKRGFLAELAIESNNRAGVCDRRAGDGRQSDDTIDRHRLDHRDRTAW
jgi:hypothetical protein